ncbi:MAG: hypothetical protein WAP74_03930 [Patescibacteria group bacterium]
MNLKSYFFGLFAATLLSFGVFLAIFFYTDPDLADFLTFAALFSSLFLSLTGALTFIIFYIRLSIGNREIIFAHLPVAARHAALIAGLVTTLAILQTLRVLSTWEVILIVFIMILVELAARSKLPTLSK